MLNVLKMDLFRMIRSKSFYITIFISVVMASFVIWAMNIETETMSENSDGSMVVVQTDSTPDSIDEYIDGIFNGNYMILFIVIFIIIFCNAERKNGYIKNIASIVSDKYKLIISKIIVLILYVIAIYAALLAMVLVGCYGFIGVTKIVSICEILKLLGTGLLMNISLGMFVIMFFTLVEKSMVVMPASIVYVLMGSTVFQLVKLFTSRVLSLDSFDAYEYTNLGNMSYVSITASNSTYIRAIVVAVVFIIISSVVSFLAAERKDIN